MAAYFTAFSLWLLFSAATQGCCGENQDSLHHKVTAMVTAMKEVSQALQCFGDTSQVGLHTMQESLSLHKQNTDIMMQVKEEIRKHNEDKDALKLENEAFNKRVVTLTQENSDLKNRLGMIDPMVQDLQTKLGEYELRVQELEKKLKELNNTAETQDYEDGTGECKKHQHLDKIKHLVQTFRDWPTLRTDLGAVLNNNSVEYKQLQQAESVRHLGFYKYAQLATLLLCAGLPVNTTDSSGYTMLHGAALNGHLHLVKLLLEHGANINARNSYGETPLIRAVGRVHIDVVMYLLEFGADITIRDNHGNTALDYARRGGCKELIRNLE